MEKRETFSSWIANKFRNAAKSLTVVNARKVLGDGDVQLLGGGFGALAFGLLALPTAIIRNSPTAIIVCAAIECGLIATSIHGWYLCEVDC